VRTCDVFRLPPREEDLAGLTSSFPFLARDRDGISKDTLGVVVVGGLIMEVSLGIEKAKKKKPDGVSNRKMKNLIQVAYTRR